MIFKNFKIIAGILVLLFLSACGDKCVRSCDSKGYCKKECPSGACVDADDWGYPKIWVPAFYNFHDPSLKGPPLNETVDGIDSGQILIDANNIPLVIQVGKRDQWTSWFGGDINADSGGQIDPNGFDGGRSFPSRECYYKVTNGTSSQQSTFASDLSPQTIKLNKDAQCTSPLPNVTPDTYADCAAPCYYRYGMGLYLGLAPDNGSKASSNDVVLSYHIPDAKIPDGRANFNSTYVYDNSKTAAENAQLKLMADSQAQVSADYRDGYLIKGMPKDELLGAQTGDRLFFKIVDTTYIDNAGGYHVKIKEGTRNAEDGPLKKLVSVFVDPLTAVMERLYNGIVKDSIFIELVRSLMVLYIVFVGYTIVISGMDAVKKDVVMRLIKLGLVATLISDVSWSFFYDHFFQLFLGGTQVIAGIFLSPFTNYDPNDPWYSMDSLLAMLWSRETWTKISSTLFSQAIGFIYIPAMAIAMGVFMLALARALITYLLAFTTIAILIVMAPIFIIFTLFEKTKDLTKEWMNQLAVVALQQIILMAALGMFAAVIIMFLQRTVGYNVCWNVFFDGFSKAFDWSGKNSLDLQFWMPDISSDKANVWMDINGDGVRDINEFAYRYIDAPYLDPVFDASLLSDVRSGSNFISMKDLLVFIGVVYLMNLFMSMVPKIASALKSEGVGGSADTFDYGTGLSNSLKGAFIGDSGKDGGVIGSTLNSADSFFNKSETGQFIKRNTLGAVKAVPGAVYGGARSVASAGMDKLRPSRVTEREEEMRRRNELAGNAASSPGSVSGAQPSGSQGRQGVNEVPVPSAPPASPPPSPRPVPSAPPADDGTDSLNKYLSRQESAAAAERLKRERDRDRMRQQADSLKKEIDRLRSQPDTFENRRRISNLEESLKNLGE